MGLSALSSEHVMETIPIPTQGADAYLINEIALVDFFRHDNAMTLVINNAFSSNERFLATEDFLGG